MSDFTKFSKPVFERFQQMSKHELFVVDISGDDVYAAYLAAFPEGTNPVYKERTEHDCSCCRNFIRNIGNVVAVIDGVITSVWSEQVKEHPYNFVTDELAQLVESKNIIGLYRSEEKSYGAAMSKQLLADGTVKTWNHFHATIDKRHQAEGGTAQGEYASAVAVFKRGLEEITKTAVVDVLDLMKTEDGLYRGEEHKPTVTAFSTLQKAYSKLTTDEARNIFVWEKAKEHGARIRNSSIGKLLQDLSEGVDLEQAVKSFETIVAPANYKRPTAVITPRMVQDAMKTINTLGLGTALERRFAHIGDVSVNNVLWVDGSVKNMMKLGIEDVLMKAAVKSKTKAAANSDEISIDDFMSKVLPTASSIDVLVSNKHSNNFVSLTAPVHADAPDLFKWSNGIGWSYEGNIADSDMRKAVQARGGSVTGVFRFTHQWNYRERNASLMDLHVFMPGNTHPEADGEHDRYGNDNRVGWNNRSHYASGGVQDVDYTDAAPTGYVPVENITFPSLAKMPDGDYSCKVHNWAHRQPTEGGFKAEIEFSGQVFEYEHAKPLKNKQWVTVAVVTKRGNDFSIEHKMLHGASSIEKWGIKTEEFVKLNTVMFSPNYWDDNTVGNKHWFFILEGCKNDQPTRGIYNEFLAGDLDKHRKVFEVLGDKTKAQPVDNQLSGLGFSSTRGDTLTVRVQGAKLQKTYNIKF